MRRSLLVVAIGALASASCAAWETPDVAARRPPGQAEISVEVMRGFSEPPTPPPTEERVEILLDLTTSMSSGRTSSGLSRADVARREAARRVRTLAPTTSVGVTALGIRDGACRAPQGLLRSSAGSPRGPLLDLIGRLVSSGEGSLPASLEIVAAGIAAERGTWRVIAITDLAEDCGGNLCRAVAGVVAAGAQLELVLVGDAQPPPCVASFVLDDGDLLRDQSRSPTFRVEANASGGVVVLARGTADGLPVELPPGAANVVVELDPPVRVGPIVFSPGARTRLRVLDFPHLGRGVREWRWDTLPIGAAEGLQ